MKVSIARRIKRAMMGLTLVLCLIFTVLSLLLVYVVEDKVFANILKNEQQQFERVPVSARQTWQPSMRQIKRYAEKKQIPMKYQQVLKNKPGIYEYFDQGEALFILYAIDQEQRAYYLTFDVSQLLAVRSSRSGLLLTVVGVSLLLLMVAVLLAVWLSNQTLRPLKKLTAQLQNRDSELPLNFATDFQGDEVGVLAEQLEQAIVQAQSAAQREFEFNRGVSHELRSPIQVAQNATELLEMNVENSQFNRSTVIKRLKRSIDQMKRITEAFLWLSTGGSDSKSKIEIGACIDQLKVNYSDSHPDFLINTKYDPEINSHHEINAPAAVFMVLMDSLITNAIQHGSEGVVNCFVSGEVIEIANNLNHRSKKTQQGGYGIGLVIVQRLCEHLGWELVVDENCEASFKIEIHMSQIESNDTKM